MLSFAVTEPTIRKLHGIFGSALEPALELYESDKVSVVSIEGIQGDSETSRRLRFRKLLQIKDKDKQDSYHVFSDINFCSCATFK